MTDDSISFVDIILNLNESINFALDLELRTCEKGEKFTDSG